MGPSQGGSGGMGPSQGGSGGMGPPGKKKKSGGFRGVAPPGQYNTAARPSGARQAIPGGPGSGMIRGSASRAAPASAAQPSAVAALTASVKYMAFSVSRAVPESARARPGPGPR